MSHVMARVLIVEDEPTICNLLEQTLTDSGHEVETAPDGLKALDQVRFRPPDLIVLDLMTPRMDGWEFLTVTHTMSGVSHIPVVISTASNQLPNDRRVRAVLKKPLDLSLLTATINSLLQGSPGNLVV